MCRILSSFSTIFAFLICDFVTCVTKIDVILLLFCIILRLRDYGTCFSLFATTFSPPGPVISAHRRTSPPPVLPALQTVHAARNVCAHPCSVILFQGSLPIFTIFLPNIRHSFSLFMIDLQRGLRYNISIKSSNSSTHTPNFEQTGGKHYEFQCQTRIHGPHHQL